MSGLVARGALIVCLAALLGLCVNAVYPRGLQPFGPPPPLDLGGLAHVGPTRRCGFSKTREPSSWTHDQERSSARATSRELSF